MAPICSDEAGKLLVPSRPAANELPVKGDTREQRGTWASAAKGAQIGQAKKREKWDFNCQGPAACVHAKQLSLNVTI